MPNVVQYLASIQYDGTNAAHICGTWADVQLVSQDASGMVVNIVGDSVVATTVPLSYWLIKTRPFPNEFSIKSPAQYEAQYVEVTP